ncbi:phosphoenolpyruvate carboxykinase [Pelagibacterium lentulum]|uniref:Phosphoenolpyruvate carboxykinase (ATP) n=1 Tax=Pelagibacterium lentulum TaxID=2029865 RepID=A0A916R920_9HYPH|nr:phosphoenolpyruvate carboxykinase [Pelagibacterium lentulum]GGA42106.1 phosphoenolpyruvate carboxykinase [ATP] [Pelagibacterium lentulum]
MSTITAETLAAEIANKARSVAYNDTAAQLVEYAIARKEGRLSADGAFVTDTGQFTGRSPSDKFIVRDELTDKLVWWDNTKALSPKHFDVLLADFTQSLADKHLFSQQLYAGADLKHQLNVAVMTPSAWHALFIRNLLIRPALAALEGFAPNVTILHNPEFKADPARHGTRSETVIALDFSRNIVLIGGTAYAGEIKKSVFSLFNFHAPSDGVLPMHCSANTGKDGDTALFFGLSGTGKTTLSTDPERVLIGDDEHGWSDDGIFNLEGGCYAKTINLSQKAEPEIYAATKKFGTVLENVVMDEATHELDFADGSKTENTRAAYPLYVLDNVSRTGTGPTPTNIVLLTADAFGVLPPIARLNAEQAIYHFLSGYTAKVAGTERGVTEPQATFSACFGAPFMSLHPTVYGRMLKKRIKESLAECWLINTGWTGGAYGVGQRISIKDTRALLNAALSGALVNVPSRTDPVFGFSVPISVPGVDSTLLNPRDTWVDKEAYDRQSAKLVSLFEDNFGKFAAADAQIAEAGPRLAVAAE